MFLIYHLPQIAWRQYLQTPVHIISWGRGKQNIARTNCIEKALLVEKAEINALLSLAGHIQCFGTYNARTALNIALHCCMGVRSKGNVSSSWGASPLTGSWWTTHRRSPAWQCCHLYRKNASLPDWPRSALQRFACS